MAALPAAAKRRVTFGVLNRPSKVTPRMLGLWARVLKALPLSRLLVLGSTGRGTRDTYQEVFREAGVPMKRVELVPRRRRAQYLELFNAVDIHLDRYPYAGMTTCDAAWMGVPTATLAGPTHVSRTGVSPLTALGAARVDRRERRRVR